MKHLILGLLSSMSISGVLFAADFHTDFDESTFAEITGLSKDSPGAPSQDFSLNTATGTLDFVTVNADMWGARNNAPMAWVGSPTASLGETWFVETYVTMEKDGSNTREVAGFGFYGADGSIPDVGLGLDDWNGWNARLQGFGDNNPNVGGADLGTAPGVFLRSEITEGGVTDTYNFFYKVNAGDAWTQLGGIATDFQASSVNSRVGIFLKSNNGGGGAQFDFLTVGTLIPQGNPEVTAISFTDADAIELSWTSIPGNRYSVEVSTNLDDWTTLAGTFDAAASPAILTKVVVDTPTANETVKYYRVRME